MIFGEKCTARRAGSEYDTPGAWFENLIFEKNNKKKRDRILKRPLRVDFLFFMRARGSVGAGPLIGARDNTSTEGRVLSWGFPPVIS